MGKTLSRWWGWCLSPGLMGVRAVGEGKGKDSRDRFPGLGCAWEAAAQVLGLDTHMCTAYSYMSVCCPFCSCRSPTYIPLPTIFKLASIFSSLPRALLTRNAASAHLPLWKCFLVWGGLLCQGLCSCCHVQADC